jgi:hypothetical protein
MQETEEAVASKTDSGFAAQVVDCDTLARCSLVRVNT